MTRRPVTISLALLACCAAPLQAQTANPYQDNPYQGAAGPVATGGFVGARLRIRLGGAKDAAGDRMRASLTVAPMQRSDGTGLKGPAWRIGEGLEFGFTGDRVAPRFSIAGMSLTSSRGAPGTRAAKQRSNLSDAGTVALVVVGLAVVAGVAIYAAADEADDA